MLRKKVTITQNDILPGGEVKLSSLMRYMQEAASEDLDQYGATYEKMRHDDMVFVIIKMGIDFTGEMTRGDEIEIFTENTAVKGVVFLREFILYKEKKPVARAATHWVLMSFSKRTPIRPALFKYGEPKDGKSITGIDLPRFLFTKEEFPENGLFVREHVVSQGEIDENRHMNNAVYADLILGLPAETRRGRVRACRIYFNAEARLGDSLLIKTAGKDHALFTTGTIKETGKTCFTSKITME